MLDNVLEMNGKRRDWPELETRGSNSTKLLMQKAETQSIGRIILKDSKDGA